MRLLMCSQPTGCGATLDAIAAKAGMSKQICLLLPSKEAIHIALLSRLENWLDPQVAMDSDGEPIEEILAYVQRKLEMARDFPRESRC